MAFWYHFFQSVVVGDNRSESVWPGIGEVVDKSWAMKMVISVSVPTHTRTAFW